GPALVEPSRPVSSRAPFLRDWARRNGISCPREFVRSYIEQWERSHPHPEDWLCAHQLTRTDYLALLGERALIQWLDQQGPAAFGLHQSFVLEWAEQNHVTLPLEFLPQGATDETLEKWIVQKGPDYFGVQWNRDALALDDIPFTDGPASGWNAGR